MKHWMIDFSIRYIDGSKKEGQTTLEARSITVALGMALENIRKPMLQDSEISDVVIWGVGIVEEEVFEDDKKTMMTVNEAHSRAVHGDRRIRFIGKCAGYWYQDNVLDFVNEHKLDRCNVVEEDDELVTVEVLE